MTDSSTPEERFAVLNLLIDGKTTEEASAILDKSTDDVRDIACAHGYPRKESMVKARDILAVALPRRNPVGDRGPEVVRVRPNTTSQGLSIRGLLEEAADYPARIRNKAAKIDKLITELQQDVENTRAENAERLRREQEAAKLRKQISDLQQQLSGLGVSKPAQRPGRKPGTPNPNAGSAMRERHQRQREFIAKHGVTVKDVRDWAEADGFTPTRSSLLPDHILAAYAAAHPQVTP